MDRKRQQDREVVAGPACGSCSQRRNDQQPAKDALPGFSGADSRREFTLAPGSPGKVRANIGGPDQHEQEQQQLGDLLKEVKEDLKETMNRLPEWQREMRNRLKTLDRETVELTVNEFIDALESGYRQFDLIHDYLSEVKDNIIENADRFRRSGETDERAVSAAE